MYKNRISERFCVKMASCKPIDIWVHAVSLGEVIAVTPLIDKLLQKKYSILVTTMTPTGSERVKSYFKNMVTHQYVPYDLPFVVARFFKHYKPKLGLIMETELWPNLARGAKQFNIPLFLINGRLSQQSYKGYRYIKPFITKVLNDFTAFYVQTLDDKKRFALLGASLAKIAVLGNIKFDLDLSLPEVHGLQDLRAQWGQERVVLMLASTHEDEESQILRQLNTLRAAIPNVLLLIAPRHQERFAKIYNLSQKLGYKTGKRSIKDDISPKTDVVILDSFGELLGAYACSDYAFVGGSLVPIGGHNMLEPIAVGIPVFSGKHIHNFKAITETLHQAEAIELVDSASELINALIIMHNNKEKKKTQVKNARAVLDNNRGALERYVDKINAVIGV